MSFYLPGDGDLPMNGDCPRVATILGMMINNHPRDDGHPWDRLKDFDHFGKDELPRDGDPPKNGDRHRDGDHPRDGGCLRIFTILRDGYLILGLGL